MKKLVLVLALANSTPALADFPFVDLPEDSLYWSYANDNDVFEGGRTFIRWHGFVDGEPKATITIRLPADAKSVNDADVFMQYGDTYICGNSDSAVSVQWRTAEEGRSSQGKTHEQRWDLSTDHSWIFMPNLVEFLEWAEQHDEVSYERRVEIFEETSGEALSISESLKEATNSFITTFRIRDSCGDVDDVFFYSEGAPSFLQKPEQASEDT